MTLLSAHDLSPPPSLLPDWSLSYPFLVIDLKWHRLSHQIRTHCLTCKQHSPSNSPVTPLALLIARSVYL